MTQILKHLPLVADESLIESPQAGYSYRIGRVDGLDLTPDEQAAIAAEIVRRVNAHDELVEALRMAEARLANLSHHTTGIFVGNAASGAAHIRHILEKLPEGR